MITFLGGDKMYDLQFVLSKFIQLELALSVTNIYYTVIDPGQQNNLELVVGRVGLGQAL